ncbi:GDSL-type esterase/lipase family protein [Candidatus Laterigemmans baculatus]|uniref:GDSL-type esterase/lipase family protein n=1 Tax=Candidatus Laterigemmans baculatus TaxID=2770505 RepID=UPI0013DBD3C8|nr:GDSL-type esterase/lipase family protein [Candidatus Laterigemmans baculatus]
MRLFLSLVSLLIVAQAAAAAPPAETSADPTAPYREAATKRWEKTIQEMERRNESEPKVEDPILFIGSSSIRLWEPEKLAEDMAPFNTLQRGYGGARYSDLAVFAERVIHPHDFRAIVMFVANDISGSAADKTPEEAARLAQHVIDVAREQKPDAPIFIVEITPTPSRADVWDETRKLNALLREMALTQPHTYFIATADHYLDAEGKARPDLFRADQLHQNEAGYEIWAQVIKQKLDQVLGGE